MFLRSFVSFSRSMSFVVVSRGEEKRLGFYNNKTKEAQSKNEYVKGKCPL